MEDKQSAPDSFSNKLKRNENARYKAESVHSNANKDVGFLSSSHHEASTGFDGSDLLVAEGIAAQQKRSALPSKTKSPKYDEPLGPCQILRERIKSLEDGLKVRDSVINVILKEIGEGETSIDASVGPINSSLQMMHNQEFSPVHSSKLQNVIQLLKNNGWDSEINSHLLNQINDQSDAPDLNQMKLSEMESQLKDKDRIIRELNLELSKKSDIIAKNKEDYNRQHSKSCVEIKNLNSKIEKLTSVLRKKEVELHETRDALHKTRNKMEENFRRLFSSISDFPKDQHGNSDNSLKLWLDDTIMKYVDSHENEVACYKKQIETLQNDIKEYELSDHEHELELIASRKAHEAHASGYKEQVDSLLKEIDSIKNEYHQQIEKFENEIERHMGKEETLKKQHSAENRKHHENVSEFLKTYDDLEKTYFKCKAELDKRNDALKEINEELAKKNTEIDLYLKEILKYESIVESYKRETQNNSTHFEYDRKQLEAKHKAEINCLNEKIDFYKGKANHYQTEMNNLLEYAKCPIEEVREILHEHKFCKDHVREMSQKYQSSEMEVNKIKQELTQSEKCHEDDVTSYKNQILKLKEELGSMASFEERLMIELSNHIQLKDEFKSLLKPSRMEAHALDNRNLDFSHFKFSSPVNQNFNLQSDHSGESVDGHSVSKSKCNISVEPHSIGSADKIRLREALASEIKKEMEGKRLELDQKDYQIECIMKTNNDLNEHCKSLEAKYEELKNFTKEKIDELESLNDSNKELSEKVEQLESEKENMKSEKEHLKSEKEHLKSKMEAMSDELSNRRAELENISDLFDFNSDDSGKKAQSFQMKRLFRNVPSSTPNVLAATAAAKLNKSKSNSNVRVIDMIVEQISHFNVLEEENEKLRRKVDEMTCETKENDYISNILKNELLSFQEKTQSLEKRLHLLECEKKNLFKFEKMIEQLSAKNKELLDSQDTLQRRIVQLEEENSALERKCNEMKIKFTLDSANDDDIGCETLENLILEFSKKAEEALSLKEELSVKQESINQLENELDRLRESKHNMQINIDVLMNDLLASEEKLTLLKQNRMDIGLEKRLLEQKLVSLQVKYDQLLNESERKAEISLQINNISMDQESQATASSCKKQLLRSRSLSSGDWCDNDNVELVISSLISLEQEKEFLKQKMKMFEQFLHKFLDSNCDRNELEIMKSELRDMYEQLEVNFGNFNLKSNSLKESNFDQLITQFDSLEKQYKEACSVLNSEKQELLKQVHDLQNELLEMQEEMKNFKIHSEKELFDKDLKIRQAELGLKALQIDNIATSYGLACKSDSRIDISKQYQKEMEKIHEMAISKLKTVYLNQIEETNDKAEQRIRTIEEKFQTQLEALQQELKEKTSHLHEMKSKYLENIFNSSSNEDLKTLDRKKEEFEENLAVIEKQLNEERKDCFESLKSAFQSYLKANNTCLNQSLKKEHNSNLEEIKTLLTEECEREKTVLKCKVEEQLKEEYKTKIKNMKKDFKNDLNTLQWIIGYEEDEATVGSRSSVLLNRLLRLVNLEYKKKLENLSEAWNSKYSEYISNVNRRLLELETKLPKYSADSEVVGLEVSGSSELEMTLSLKEKLINTSEEFYKFLLEFHKTSLENVLTNLKDAHNEVSSRVDELQLELEKGCLIASLKQKVEELEKEKDEMETQLKSAIGLLSKEHETESVNVTKLLKDSSIVTNYMDHTSLIDVEAKVEEKLKKQYEEQFVKQRKYFENLVAELGKKFKTDANNSLKTMKQDEINQLKRHRDDVILASNQTDSKYTTTSKPNCEEQVVTKKQCSESVQFNNSSDRDVQSREGYLELPKDDTDVIEEFDLPWKEPDCKLIESDKNDSTKFGFESKLFHLENEKRELERVIETLSKQNNVNEDQILVLKREINAFRAMVGGGLCENCGKATVNNPLRMNNEFGCSQYVEQSDSKHDEKYEYLFRSLQQRVNLLSQNLSLEASVKSIVDNVKTSYESDIELMQYDYDRAALIENTKNEELIRKFDHCLEKMNSQHFSEKEQLKKQMNKLVEDYEERLRESNEYVVRLIDSQKNLEAKHDEEMKFTKLEFEDYLVEILSDCISKFALQSSVMDIESSKEEFESELKQKTDDIAKVIQTEYENRLEEERRIMLKEFCELQRNMKVNSPEKSSMDVQEIEKRINEKFERKLVSLASKHEAELSSLKAHYELQIQQLIEKYECDPAEFMSNSSNCGMTDSITVETLIKERDDLHKVVVSLRTAIRDIGNYLLNCEDELNKTLIQSMISNYTDSGEVPAANNNNNNNHRDSFSDNDSSMIDKSKHVHFAPDVSAILEGDLDGLDKRHDMSMEFRQKLELCMKRLKSEAAAVLQLTSSSKPGAALRSVESRRLASVTRQLVDKNKQIKELDQQLKEAHEMIAKYEQELVEMKAELDLEKSQREKDKANCSLELVYADSHLPEQAGTDSHFQNLSQLQAKARTMVNESSESGLPPHTISIVEEMCQHVDHILEEARKEKEDLQSQIDSADKQLRNTRKFLDDQANEREMERDEFTRAITKLKQQLQDKERDWMSKERFASENSAFENGSLLSKKVEALEQKVQETTNLLKETEEKKDSIDRELREADQKVLVLKEIIRDLECQDRSKTQRQMTLEQRLDELERELESQKNDQNAMVLELEAMQDGSPRDINLKQLEEHFKKQFNPNVVEQMKSQLREMARSIQRQTKYMEGLNVHISSASLSSPSEDISIREQLDLFKCQTPEGCRSPLLSLPTEEISLLQDLLSRHTKIEEIAMKRIRDQEMQLNSLQSRYEDVLAEKEVLQVKCDKQLSTIASTKTTLDEVRRRAEWQQNKCDAINLEKIALLENELHSLHNSMKNKEREIAAQQQQINNLQRILGDKEAELCSYVDSQNNQVDFLQQKLKVMEIEKEKMMVMLNKMRDGHNISLPALMEQLLAEKNADIDHLEQMVKELRDGLVNTSFVESQSSSKKSSHSNSKGHRVSFADDVEVSHINDAERTRDANFSNVMRDFSPHFSSTVKSLEKSEQRMITPPLLHAIPEDDSKAGGDFTDSWERPSSPKNNVIQQGEFKIKLDVLQKELTWKTELIESYEKRLQDIPLLEGELKRARDDLASTISEISEDKKYYQEQLELMTALQKQLNERETEVQELKDAIALREENLVRVKSDFKSLQLILDKTQKKIEDAKKSTLCDDTKQLSEEVERLKDENIHHVQEILVLKKELNKVSVAKMNLLKENLSDEQKVSEKLRNDVSNLLKEKDSIVMELETSKQKCVSLKKELDNTSSQLVMAEKEIDKLQKDLESSTELNDSLKMKLNEANQEINLMSRKMSSEMSNRVQKDSDDLIRMKDELERLRSINHCLESDCESLKKELNSMVGETTALTKITESNSKIKGLEVELDKLRDEREMLLQSICTMKEKFDTEKSRCETFLSAAEAYKNSETLAQEKVLKEKELRTSAEKKSQFLKREYEKLKRAKKELEKKNTVLKDELDKEKKHTMELENSPSRGRKTLADLQVTPVDAIEIIPFENQISGSIDDLTGQLQNELDTSARLDDTLLSTLDMQANTSLPLLPSESLVAILQKVIQHGFKNLTREEMDHLYEELTLHSHRPPRIAGLMERINKLQNELRKQLKIVDNLHGEINDGNSCLTKEKERVVQLETELDRQQNIISYQEERLASLSSIVEQNRTQMSELKLSLLKERGNFKKLHVLFEGERDKIKQIQKEDTELIEDLRICLEKEKDSKVRLQLCLEQERERLQTLEAQLNAAQAAEQIASRPFNQSDHLNKCLDEWRGKLTEIGVELEREKRHVDSLSASLNKEKQECEHLRTELYKKSAECIDLQAEVDQLKCEIGKERSTNREMTDKMKTIQEAEMRRQRNRAAAEEKHRRALERAKIQKRDLEVEVARLRTQLVTIKGEEPLPSWSDDAESEPLLNQIKDVNFELEKLGREKKQLTSTVKALLEENEHLELLISQSTGKQFPESELSYFISLYIRSKSHRKALIWQKRYLMLSLQGYQDEGQRLAMKISSSLSVNRSWVPQLSITSKPSFKHAALVVIALTRMKKIMSYRKDILGIHYKTQSPMKEHLIRRKLKLSSPRNERMLIAPSPIREMDFLASPQRNTNGKNEGLLKPTRLADYLETFNELQARLSQALNPPDNISLGLESKILSKVSH